MNAPYRRCAKCGNPENNHPYRHVFQAATPNAEQAEAAEEATEPRPSSTLLKEAIVVRDILAASVRNAESSGARAAWKKPLIDSLSKAIEAEEARGPSESSYHVSLVADLRAGKDVGSEAAEAIIALEQSEARLEAFVAMAAGVLRKAAWTPKIEPIVEAAKVAAGTIHRLRRERNEAVARAETAEVSADVKLREFADWIRSKGDCTEEEALTEIDRMLANPPSDAVIVHREHYSWRHCLAGWLERRFKGATSSPDAVEDVVAILARRALREGGK